MSEKILLFDGVCNLCNGLVVFTIKRDSNGRIRFGALQSDEGKKILQQLNIQDELPDTFILIEDGNYYVRSTAALRLFKSLDGLWPMLYLFIIVPRFIRDYLYNKVAENRYRFFGKRDECMVPAPDLKERFLEQE